MSSRTYHRTLVLALALSTGALALPAAQAALARSYFPPASSIQDGSFTRSLFESLQKLWGLLKDNPHHPANPHQGPDDREGSGVCPHGGGMGPRP